MKKNYTFFLSLIFLFALPKSSTAETCQWTNIYDNNKVETIPLNVKPGLGPDGENQYESCEEATDRVKRAAERRQARINATSTITGGTKNDCKWTSPDLPDRPSQSYPVEVRQIGEDPDTGEPQYESCTNAQKRTRKQWIDNEWNGHRDDANAAITAENERREQEAMSANEKAKKAAEKQQKTSLVATAGAMAAGVTAAACYSSCSASGSGCCSAAPYFAALSAGLGLAGMALGLASGSNKETAAKYQGLLPPDTNNGTTTADTTGGLTTSGNVTLPPPVVLSDPNIPLPKITINGQAVVPTPGNLGPFFEEQGLKWDPKKKSITLPDGRSYTADDADNPEFRKYASSGPATNLKKQMKGLEAQIDKAMGSDDELSEGTEEVADNALGGGGFSGYDGGRSSGGGGGALVASLGRKPGSSENDEASKVAGMSVKMGKGQVGVSQDNIFEMIHRRYQKKRKKQQFIEIGL